MTAPDARRATAWTAAAVLVPALLGATLLGLATATSSTPPYRASGVIELSEVAGNQSSGQLAPYAADLETALLSPPVRAQVREVLGPEVPVSLAVARLPEASRVTFTLQADSAERAERGLLVAGRAAYGEVVDQQVQLLDLRERAAQRRVDGLAAEVRAARGALPRGAGAADAQAALDRQQRLLDISVEELSMVQGQSAVAQELAQGAGSTDAVAVQAVEPANVLPQVLPVAGAGFVGGALLGGLAEALLRRRRRQGGPDGRARPVGPLRSRRVPELHPAPPASSEPAAARR